MRQDLVKRVCAIQMYPVTISVHTEISVCWAAFRAGSSSRVKLKQQPKNPSVPTMPTSLSDFCGCKSYFLACRKILILPEPGTLKYICTAAQFCIYGSTGPAAKAGQCECIDTEGSPQGNMETSYEMCWPHHCTDNVHMMDGTAPLNCPWNTRTKCDPAVHQNTFLNNSGTFTFTITVTLKVYLKASIDFTVCPSVLWGGGKTTQKITTWELTYPSVPALHTQLNHPQAASLTQFPLVTIYSQTTCGFYQKALCTTPQLCKQWSVSKQALQLKPRPSRASGSQWALCAAWGVPAPTPMALNILTQMHYPGHYCPAGVSCWAK